MTLKQAIEQATEQSEDLSRGVLMKTIMDTSSPDADEVWFDMILDSDWAMFYADSLNAVTFAHESLFDH